MAFEVKYAGETDRQHGIYAVERPAIPAPVERTSTPVEIPGQDHTYVDGSGIYDDMVIPVKFNYISRDPSEWGWKFREAVLWLRKRGVLQFSDDMSVFYRVRRVEIGEDERAVKRIGRFAANFICLPGWYLLSGSKFVPLGNETYINEYSEARPIFEITGTGTCTLVVNGNAMEAKVDGKLYIDTERELAYKSENDRQNTAVKGYYERLHLLSGKNTITVSEGFALRLQSNKRIL